MTKQTTVRLIMFFYLIATVKYSVAQNSDLLPGYIITNAGDTVSGYLKYESDTKLKKRVLFYKNKTDNIPEIYTPSDIEGFSFNTGRYFKSFQQKDDTASVFAKKLISGKVNMFVTGTNSNKKNTIFLFRSDTSMMVELNPPEKSVHYENGEEYHFTYRKYIGKIAYITSTDISEKNLNTLNYNTRIIKKYLTKYNDLYKDTNPVTIYRDSSRYSFDIMAGFPFRLNFNKVTCFRTALYFDKTFVEKNPNISIRMGGSFSYRNSNEGVDKSVKSEYQMFKKKTLSILPVGIKYFITKKRIIAYAYILLGFTYNVHEEYVVRDYELHHIRHDTFVGTTINPGVGTKFKINSGFILFEITPILNLDGYPQLMFNLGFSFTKRNK